MKDDERSLLLKIARQALIDGVNGRALPSLELDQLSPRLRELGASFVTLTCKDQLRGCVGSIEPLQPLAEDVRHQAIAAALQDYRFPPVSADELPGIHISISVLTKPVLLEYKSPEDLLSKLRPGIDGVILKHGLQRATFLPQVWEKIPDVELFLSMLCQKMGAPSNLWRIKHLQVLTYQVEEIHE